MRWNVSFHRLALRTAIAGALAMALPGCQTYRPETSPDFPEATEQPLVLEAGDEIQVLYTYWPDLDIEQTIRPDGKISLKMVGEVMAGGKTPYDLQQELLALYADKIKDPDITIVVEGLGSQRVYVAGEVKAPTLVPLTGKLTMLEAIMMAGGYDENSAKLTHVLLVRTENGKRYAKTVDLTQAMKQGESEPIYLQPYDVVFVPRTAIDKVNQFVTQYVSGVVPDEFQANYVWSDLRDQESAESRSVNVNLPNLF